MNILKIAIGHEYDEDYSDYLFRTNRPKEDFYDCMFVLTEWFTNWLKENHPEILEGINDGRTDMFYFHEDSLEEIA